MSNSGRKEKTTVEIETHGQISRSFVRLLSAFDPDGVRVEVSGDSLDAYWIDTANVGTGAVHIDLDSSLDSIESVTAPDGMEFVAGVQPNVLANRLSFARKTVGGEFGDPVTLRIEDGPVETMLRGSTHMTIRRENNAPTLTRETSVRNLNPESISEAVTPDIDMRWAADIDPQTFNAIVSAFNDSDASHVQLRCGKLFDGVNENAREFVAGGKSHDDRDINDEFRVESAARPAHENATDETDGSLMSLSYLDDVASALKQAKMDQLTVRWRDDFPIAFEFSKAEWGISGRYLVAPRIVSEEGPP